MAAEKWRKGIRTLRCKTEENENVCVGRSKRKSKWQGPPKKRKEKRTLVNKKSKIEIRKLIISNRNTMKCEDGVDRTVVSQTRSPHAVRISVTVAVSHPCLVPRTRLNLSAPWSHTFHEQVVTLAAEETSFKIKNIITREEHREGKTYSLIVQEWKSTV